MILRSFLFVPADSERKLAQAKASAADALIIDLGGSVLPENRAAARGMAREFLQSEGGNGASLWVRINPVGTRDYEDDLDAVIGLRPAGIVLPKPDSPDALHILDCDTATLEDRHNIPSSSVQVMPVASETPMAVITMMDYRKPPPRLAALAWGADDLADALGATTNRETSGAFSFTFQMVRSMALIAAKAAGVDAIETFHADFRDFAGLTAAAEAAQREGFGGMLAVHPDQVGIINAAFTPPAADVDQARRILAAFALGTGIMSDNGKAIDLPYLKQAKQILMKDEMIRARRA